MDPSIHQAVVGTDFCSQKLVIKNKGSCYRQDRCWFPRLSHPSSAPLLLGFYALFPVCWWKSPSVIGFSKPKHWISAVFDNEGESLIPPTVLVQMLWRRFIIQTICFALMVEKFERSCCCLLSRFLGRFSPYHHPLLLSLHSYSVLQPIDALAGCEAHPSHAREGCISGWPHLCCIRATTAAARRRLRAAGCENVWEHLSRFCYRWVGLTSTSCQRKTLHVHN